MINIADILIEDKRWNDFRLQNLADKTFGIIFENLKSL